MAIQGLVMVPEHRHVFDLLGGRLCIDFVNTVSGKRLRAPIERLNDYGDLVAWAEQVGIASPTRGKALRRAAREHPRQGEAILGRAKEFREALFRIFRAVGERARPGEADLAHLNRELAEAHSHLVLADRAGRFGWHFSHENELASVLWPVARSAAEVLLNDDPERVRMCEAIDGCGWLFYDETRNGRRRWCSMKDCGNRAKVRRFYAKNKGGADSAGSSE
jgi:predicted RNA-binding Zn ribbon-like protein